MAKNFYTQATILNELRNADTRDLDIDELVALAAFGRFVLFPAYEDFKIKVPEWLGDRLKAFSREIKFKEQDEKAIRLRTAKAELDKLKTDEEKRTKLAAEIADLEGTQEK